MAAYASDFELFESKCMPFVFWNATATFQRRIKQTLLFIKQKAGSTISCYIDDKIIILKTIAQPSMRLTKKYRLHTCRRVQVQVTQIQHHEI